MHINSDEFESFSKPTCLSRPNLRSSDLRFTPIVGDIVLLKHMKEGVVSGRVLDADGGAVTVELQFNGHGGLHEIRLPAAKISAVVLGD